MFFDWVKVQQEFAADVEIPQISTHGYTYYDIDTGDIERTGQSPLHHEGSFSTKISISVRGQSLTVDGNISRLNRLDNLFGFTTLEQCVTAINRMLKTIHPDMPQFTKCTHIFFPQGDCGSKVSKCSDGAVFKRLDICTNRSVGEGAVLDYIKGVSTQRYRNSIPRLHTNGRTCDWLSAKGKAGLLYPSVYDKAFEIEQHQLPKIKRQFGEQSKEYCYLLKLISFIKKEGVARFEQKLSADFLKRHDLCFYGLFDESEIKNIQQKFLDIDKTLQVEAMTLECISEQLISNGVCDTTYAANTTSMYAIEWMHGKTFDLAKSATKKHRARLRKIGIDIANTCDISRFSPVKVVRSHTIEVKPLSVPSWYSMPSSGPKLRAVA